MKYLKKHLILLFLFLFIIPMAFGEIIITLPEKDLYNLGEKVVPSVSIKEEQDYYGGRFSLHIFCDNYDELYYITPLSPEANFRRQLTVPELTLSKSMTTKCSLKSNFKAIDGENVDTAWSKEFFVTDELDITINVGLEAKPGEDVILLGIARKHSGELLSEGEAEITFKDTKSEVEVSSFGKFEHTIHLDANVEAGDAPIRIIVTDKYGNYGDQLLDLRVLPISTRIENSFENSILMPGDTLKARVSLYDHNGKVINGSRVNVRIFDPDENLIAEKDIQNLNYFEFKTEKTQMPGNYFLLSAFEDVKEQSTFEIEAVRKIIMNQDGSFVHIENTGNVGYKDEVTIILESDDKKYLINKKIDLKPEEKIMIDLSKEVPQGTYDIILPAETVEEDITDSTNGSSQDVVEQTNVVENVEIDDNRNVIKKTADGMSAITGAVAGAAGYVASRPTLAAVILVLIILGTVARYSKGFIINKIKGKKESDTSHIFEDFKYKENEDNKPGN
ncbi:MAG: hypothetical protein KAS87_03650 [Candidatus Omnitrophica bacterium]|nr:hypothetical protein [Candidatus Omnitrophota bacterium]